MGKNFVLYVLSGKLESSTSHLTLHKRDFVYTFAIVISCIFQFIKNNQRFVGVILNFTSKLFVFLNGFVDVRGELCRVQAKYYTKPSNIV